MPAQDKTEKATPKRRNEVREKGQVARSMELGTAVAMLIAWLVFRVFGPSFISSFTSILTDGFSHAKQPEFTEQTIRTMGMDNMILFGKLLLPICGALMVAGLVTNMLQVGLHFTPKAAQPQISRINPLSGFKRLFTLRSVQELVKGLLKLGLIGFLCYQVINNHLPQLLAMTGGDLRAGIGDVADIAMELLLKVGAAYLVLAVADYAYQRWDFEKSIKMTKQEIKEESRAQDLAPELRGRIRSLQRQLARKRMMQRVPTADVVITNPTHYAVALKYDASKMAAPKVIAKGQRLIAQQIKTIAREHGVPLVENKPLAQALFKAVEVDREVPRDLYQAVAEVLAFIYRLKNKNVTRLAS